MVGGVVEQGGGHLGVAEHGYHVVIATISSSALVNSHEGRGLAQKRSTAPTKLG